MWLFALFVLVPILEIALFIQVGGWLGLWPTLGIVVLTALAGTYLVRRQGLAHIRAVQGSLSELRDPTRPLAHGAMILASGLLLLTPGFFTDAVGFALLVPGVRDALMRFVRSRITVQSFTLGQSGATGRPGGSRPQPRARDTIIEGEVVEASEPVAPSSEAEIRSPDRRSDRPSGWTRP